MAEEYLRRLRKLTRRKTLRFFTRTNIEFPDPDGSELSEIEIEPFIKEEEKEIDEKREKRIIETVEMMKLRKESRTLGRIKVLGMKPSKNLEDFA
ncbi:hypothetical protein Tco_0264832 [Tanacetum coccineum]